MSQIAENRKRQTVVTWYLPEEKLPEEGIFTIVSFSGKCGCIVYDHTFGIGEWFKGDGWIVDGVNDNEEITVHAWCDLEPYGGKA